MSKRLTTEEFIKKAILVHGNKYDYSDTVYVTTRIKVSIRCPEHGVFEQKPYSHLSGNGCPLCARAWTEEHKENLRKSSRKSRGMNTLEWIERAKSVHGDKYDYSQTKYVNQRTKVKIICPVHGLFEQNPNSHLRGCGCRLCGLESENRKGVHFWSDEQRQKTAQTCLRKYGATRYLDSDEGKQKNKEIRSSVAFRQKMSQIISSDAVQEKTKLTSIERYGVEYPMQLPTVYEKVADSKRANGTWSTSKPEEKMFTLLVSKFGQNDIIRQYNKDPRYPFHVDFYIKSLDVFIELNATWLHGGHWFDSTNPDDLSCLQKWNQLMDEGHKFYEVAIDVWTVRDVKKHDTAIENQINYLVFWDNDLTEFKQWLNSKSLILNNVY
jgi:hypothetical protein